MGLVVMTYKLNPDSDVEDVNPEDIADYIKGLAFDVICYVFRIYILYI